MTPEPQKATNLSKLLLGAGLAWAPAAHAHGEEILAAIYSQFFAVLAGALTLLLMRRTRHYRMVGIIGLVAGVFLDWWAMADVAYDLHPVLVAVSSVVLPLMGAAAAVALKRMAKRKPGHP